MNYLAHFFLAGDAPGLIVGNFIADAVKGNVSGRFPAPVREGIVMHRNIDFYTDTHAVTSRSKDRLRESFNHYAGVIVDIFYDHFLAKHWNEFSEEPLPVYSQRIYSILEAHREHFPERNSYMLPYMKKHDWLTSYAEVEGIRRALTGMAHRTKFDSKMEFAADALLNDYDAFREDFMEFFPELIAHTEPFRDKSK